MPVKHGSIDDRSTVSWSAHPAREQPQKTVLAIVVIVMAGFAVAGWLWVDQSGLIVSIIGGAIASAILVLALNRFFFPSKFSIDDEGIDSRYVLKSERFRWSEIRRFLHDEYGGFLSRRARRSRFDAFQGMHIRWGIEDREELISEIRRRIDGARVESSPSNNLPEREDQPALETPDLAKRR